MTNNNRISINIIFTLPHPRGISSSCRRHLLTYD